MFERHLHLPVDYYFLMVSMFECSHHAPTYVMEIEDASRRFMLRRTSKRIVRLKNKNGTTHPGMPIIVRY